MQGNLGVHLYYLIYMHLDLNFGSGGIYSVFAYISIEIMGSRICTF
jgi:hypothetical protein